MKMELSNLIVECSAELNDIAAKISSISPLDKTRMYLANYSLIKACGTLEFVYRSIVADFFDKSVFTQIHTYIDNTVRKGSMSATYDNMCGLLGKFDDGWKKDFQNAIQTRPDGQRIISSAKSLVTNRHSFAHGKAMTASFSDICQYYNDALELIYALDNVVK